MGEVTRKREAGPEAATTSAPPPVRWTLCKYTSAELFKVVAAAWLCYANEM